MITVIETDLYNAAFTDLVKLKQAPSVTWLVISSTKHVSGQELTV